MASKSPTILYSVNICSSENLPNVKGIPFFNSANDRTIGAFQYDVYVVKRLSSPCITLGWFDNSWCRYDMETLSALLNFSEVNPRSLVDSLIKASNAEL